MRTKKFHSRKKMVRHVHKKSQSMGREMDAHRVFVIWKHPLFLESLRLLLQNDRIQWVGSSTSNGNDYSEIRGKNPDTILVEEEEGGDIPNNVIHLLESSPTSVRIFRLSLADNDLMIYHRERRSVMQAEDLLNLIREGE